jgi:hypothetical protein
MSAKSEVKAGFQLVAKDFHTGGMIVDGLIDKIVAAVNHLDLNKDGISDVAEYIPTLLKLFPSLAKFWALIDQPTLINSIINSPAIPAQYKAQAQAIMADITATLTDLGTAAPSTAKPATTTTTTTTKS